MRIDTRPRSINRMIHRALVHSEVPRQPRVGTYQLNPIVRCGNVVETPNVLPRPVRIAQKRRFIQSDQYINRSLQSNMRSRQSNIPAMTMSNDVQLLSIRETMLRNHLPQPLSRPNPIAVIIPARTPFKQPCAIPNAASPKRPVPITKQTVIRPPAAMALPVRPWNQNRHETIRINNMTECRVVETRCRVLSRCTRFGRSCI